MLLQHNLPHCWLPASKTCSCLSSFVPASTVVSVYGNSYNVLEKAFFICVLRFPEEVSWETSLTPLKQIDICGTTAFCTPVEHTTSAAAGQTGCKGVDYSALECNFSNCGADKSLFCTGLQRNWRHHLFHLSVPRVSLDWFSFFSQKGGEIIHPPWMLFATPVTLGKFITWPCTVHGRH